MYQSYQLKNKVNIHLVPLKDTKSVTTLVMYPVGSRYESEKMRGVSHYVEHLMFKGTKKRKSTLILTREIDRLGAAYNAFTSKEYTGYYVKTDEKYSDVALDILSDMLFNSTFDAKEMEREKKVIVEEIRMYKDNPMMNIDNIFEDLMFAGSKLGRDIAGTEKHVLGYKRSDVLAYRDKYYQPANMHVVVSGAITEKVENQIREYFSKKKNTKGLSKVFGPASFGPVAKKDRLFVEKKETDQAQLMFGFPGLEYGHKQNPVSSVMNTILGGSMSSRLFIQIRERRGLAYMIRSGAELFRDSGYFFVRAGLDAKNINKAISVTRQEIQKIIDKGVTKRELEDAKTHIRGSLTLHLEDSSAQASWYAHQVLFQKKVLTPEEKLAKIDRVTNEDIKALAKRVYNFDKMRVAIIGNVDESKVQF